MYKGGNMNDFKGFTLAETLITLGIIGVVVALTIPTLVANYKKQMIISQLKATYSILNQAFKMAEVKNGPIDTWTGWNSSATILEQYILPEIKGAQYYGMSGDKGWKKPMCYDETVKLQTGHQCQYTWFPGARSYMSTPMGWYTSSFKLPNGACVGLNPNNYTPYHLFIDVNGGKGPNAAGKDLFIFIIDNNQIQPFGFNLTDDEINNGTGVPGTYRCGRKNNTVGYTCATRIIRDGWKINYY